MNRLFQEKAEQAEHFFQMNNHREFYATCNCKQSLWSKE